MSKAHVKAIAMAASLAALTASTAAFGQAAAPADPPPAGDSGEIVVTAQKRSESIQQVPISITALSGAALASAGIQQTEQLANRTPGLLVQRSVVGKISVRGIGNENYTISGDPGVAVHSDGVYVARAAAGLFDLFDIDRVEVLRGPQGTLYGRNATGGVINVLPNQPTDEFAGRAYAEYGNYNDVRLEGMINAPLGSGFAARIAAMGNWRDGFTKNTFPGAKQRGFDRFDSKDVAAVRGQLAYDGGGPFKARLAVEYIDDESNLPAYKYLNRPAALPTADFGGFGKGDLRTVDQGIELAIPGSGRTVGSNSDVFLTRQLGVSLHLDYDLGPVSLASITGYRRTRFNYLDDGDGADVFYVNYIQQDRNRQYSQELQLSSNGGGPISWLLGGFYFRETGSSFISLPFPFGANLPFYITIDGTAKTDAAAAFGELRWQATDRLKLTLGARYSHEKRAAAYRYEINFGASTVQNPDLAKSFNAFTPRLVVDYKATDDVNLYASVTKGFKSGGFNLLAVQPGFAPEKVLAYEAGVKTKLAGNRITLNGDVFYYDYKDIQVGQIVNLQSVLTNAAKSTLYGAEVEFSARPTDAIELGATAAYLHSRYDKFCSGDPTKPTYGTAAGAAAGLPTTPDAGCTAAGPIDLKGNVLPRAPKLTLTGTAAYTVTLANASAVTLRGDVRYQSRIYFTQFNRPTISQGGYATVNARLSWTSSNKAISLSAFAQNLLNKTYFNEVLESGAFNPQLVAQAYVAPPRTYGISASYNF